MSLRFACLAILAAALGSWAWWGRNHLRGLTPGDVQSRAGSTVGTDAQQNVKAVPSSAVSKQAVAAPTPGAESGAIPERLQFILNGDGTKTFPERVRSLHAINRNLMIEEVEALYKYLRTPAKDGADRVRENWLRNDIMDILVEQPALPQGYPDVLIAIYEDKAQDAVVRDYALQHIPPVYDRANTQEKVDLQNALWQATGETDSSIAGTSLLALLELTGTDAAVDQGRVADTAFKIAANDNTGELSRITAVQVCGRMNVEPALPVIEQLAQDAPTIPLRIAATAAMGNFLSGDKGSASAEARNLLTQLAASTEPRQALAAQSALGRSRTQAILGGQVGH